MQSIGINKKGSASTTFSLPNLTINLTYLCHGMLQKYIIYLWIPLDMLIYFSNSSNNFKNHSFLFKVSIDFLTNSYH
ncbi:MAG TPA: hypothetical protein DCR56_01930 [Flavobacteriaceae bacterium]|nr:hypothetical protein [Flavobacteriaceae bacterium]